MVIVLHGKDAYRRDKRLAQLKDGFQQKYDPSGINVSSIDGSSASIDDLQRMTASAGLFAEKRFVVLTNPFGFSIDDQEMLAEMLSRIPEETILCVSLDMFPQKKSPLKKPLKTADKVEEFPPLSVGEAERFIHTEAKTHGAGFEPPAANLLATRLHENTWQLALTVKSLCYQVHGQQPALVTTTLAQEALGEAAAENFFGMNDAIGEKNTARALSLLQQHIAEGAAIQLLLSVIGKQLLHMRILATSPTTTITGVHPFVLKKAAANAKRYSLETLNRAHEALVQLDEEIKSGNAPDPASRIALIITELHS